MAETDTGNPDQEISEIQGGGQTEKQPCGNGPLSQYRQYAHLLRARSAGLPLAPERPTSQA